MFTILYTKSRISDLFKKEKTHLRNVSTSFMKLLKHFHEVSQK